MKMEIKKDIYQEIHDLLHKARQNIISNINSTMTKTYFLIGKRIVEEEQNGNKRAEYGKKLIKMLSKKLTKEFGKGFSETNLKQMKTFYINYEKSQTLSAQFKLSWSHYLILMRIENINARNFYEIEAFENNWSLRELKRQVNSSLYERLVLSKDKEKVKELAVKGQIIEKAQDIIKDPYILEFLEVIHQDLGQMQMYVNYYDRYVKLPDENDTIGIIICKDKNDTLVKLTLPKDNNQIFASRYTTILPSLDEFKKIIEE